MLVQVHREERRRAGTARRRRSCPSRSSATTARACTPTSRSGRTASRCSPATATRACREMALYYIGGILKHAKALAALRNPTTNSYKRLVPGYEAPVNLAYSQPQPLGRHPHPDVHRHARRPSASSSAARTRPATRTWRSRRMLMAGLDGIQNKIDPGEPLDKDIYDLLARGAREGPARCRAASRRRSTPCEGPRVPAQGRRLHRGRHRHLDRVQARERGRRGAPAPAPARVPAVLRHLGKRAAKRRARSEARPSEDRRTAALPARVLRPLSPRCEARRGSPAGWVQPAGLRFYPSSSLKS